jgi:pyruvate/2-oxoglutarate/acetoin dehydrogenase E1 component
MQALANVSNSEYKDELSRAMEMLAEDDRVVFLGQGCRDPGTFMSTTLEGVAPEKKIELPVAENMQLGMSTGMALDGRIPVSIFPRYQFLLSAMDQLVNHVDVMQPHVIIRVGVGSTVPLDPGPQHKGDLTQAFRMMLRHTPVLLLKDARDIVPAYRYALGRAGPTVIAEIADNYYKG